MEKYLVICAATIFLRRDVFVRAVALITIISYICSVYITGQINITEAILLSGLSDSVLLALLLFFARSVKHKLSILVCIFVKLWSIFIWQYPFSIDQSISYYILNYTDILILELLFMICASDLNFKKFMDYMYTIFLLCTILLF